MGIEINLMKNYPLSKRDVTNRGKTKTEEDRTIARKFGKEFFDGSRDQGYGGFSYQSRFWQPVIPDFKNHFNLDEHSLILDIGCAKGFMIYDFTKIIPGINVKGIDISKYAIENSIEPIKDHLQIGCATNLPYPDNHFDAVFSITTLHNLEEDDLAIALQEIERVTKGSKSFITLDAYCNSKERERMESWNLTAKTVKHVDDWISFFKEVGFNGDYYWFKP